MKKYYTYWGKADRKTGRWHPLIFHMLDVAAVAKIVLERDSSLRSLFSDLSAIDATSMVPVMTLAAAFHDVGKASVFFQNKIPEYARRNGLFYEIAAQSRGFDHGAFGCLWIDDWCTEDLHFREWSVHYPVLQNETFIKLWKAACWHHGRALVYSDYCSMTEIDSRPRGKGTIFDKAAILRSFLLQEIAAVLIPGECKALQCDNKLSPSFLRLFAGFVSMCDWIGSNEEYFTYEQPEDVSEYWKRTRESARRAIEKINLISNDKSASVKAFKDVIGSDKIPRPVQQALGKTAVTKPILLIVEAPTGEGKTEAALFQFARNAGRGFYFGLPTQASANQISGRIRNFLKDIVKTREEAILAHGNAWLVKLIQEEKSYGNTDDLMTDTAAETELSDWYNSKKRTLLSHYGVGTVDQAMMAALNVKHGFVKLFGLAGKTLIIDEVHAYDSFMLPILEHLLRWCGYIDTTVVLLSATLPSFMKQRLINAYLDAENGEYASRKEGYPLLTAVEKTDKKIEEIDSLNGKKIQTRKKELVRVFFSTHRPDDVDAIVDQIISKTENGGNILWICNTVKKAQFVYESIKHRIDTDDIAIELRLFHSRYTKKDRLAIEEEIEDLYGDGQKSPLRPGRSILIATQVAEQSLDIDFDYLITDIAPIDLILQRAGRVFRHDRGNRSPGFSAPAILVLLPSSVAELKDFSGVYDTFTVLKTISELAVLPESTIELPEMYRVLVENIYNDIIPDISRVKAGEIILEISHAVWDNALHEKLKKAEELDTKGRRGLIPLPSNEYPADSILLNEDENSYWAAKTRDGVEKVGLILVLEFEGKYMAGESELVEAVPEKITSDMMVQMSLDTVEVGIKGLVKKLKRENCLHPDNTIISTWQGKIDRVPVLKGRKLLLLDQNRQAQIDSGGVIYLLRYSRETGLVVQAMK